MNRSKKELVDSLFLNSIRFLTQSTKDIKSRSKYIDSSTKSIFAAVHLGVGLELLLKSRLAAEHWSFVFKDIDSAKLDVDPGKLRSVSATAALSRVESLCGVSLNTKHKKSIDHVFSIRNQAVHHAYEPNTMQIKTLIADAFDFAFDFVKSELRVVSKRNPGSVEKLHGLMLEYDQFVKRRLQRVSREYDLSSALSCTDCFHPAVVYGKKGIDCRMCHMHRDWDEMSVVEDGFCISCGNNRIRIASVEPIPDSDGLPDEYFECVCPKCLERQSLIECPRCETLHDGDFFCYACQSWSEAQ